MKKVFMKYILPILGVALVVLLDQWVKELCLDKIGMYNAVVVIEDVFELRVIPNRGMAWGMLQNKQWLFVAITPLVLGLVIWFYLKMPYEKKFLPMRVLTVMLTGGAIGNLLDRMFRGEFCKGHVVDMFYVKAIDFPVFNVADSFICVSFALLAILVLFKYSEEDFDRMFHLKKKVKTKDIDKTAEENDTETVEDIASEAIEETSEDKKENSASVETKAEE